MAERNYIHRQLKKEIIAYVEVKKIERNNSGDRNLYSLSIEVQEA